MAKNRKRDAALHRLLPLTKGLVLCGIVATVGFGYVWQKNSIYRLGDDIKVREQQLDALRKRNDVLSDQIARLTSPGVIEDKCKAWNLGLAVPKESQIVRLPDPSTSPSLPDGGSSRPSTVAVRAKQYADSQPRVGTGEGVRAN